MAKKKENSEIAYKKPIHQFGMHKISDAMVEEAIRASGGILTGAVTYIKKTYDITVTRQAIKNRIDKNAELTQVLYDVNEGTKDFVENKFREMLLKGDKTCMIFYLKTQCKDRGYAERKEITGENGTPLIKHNITVDFSDEAIIE